MRRAVLSSLLAALAGALTASCASPRAEPLSPDRGSGPAEAQRHAAGDAPEAGSPAEPPAPARVRYDLAAHLDHAEVQEGQVLAMDHGEPAGAKYTLGGWQTWARDHVLDDTSVTLADGTRVKLIVPWEHQGPATLTLRARTFRPGPLHVYVGEEHLTTLEPEPGAFQVHRLEVPAELLSRGDNTLLLRTTRTASVEGVHRSGVAVDWIRIGPRDVAHGEERPPGAELAVELGSHPAIRMPADLRLGWGMEVPARARLRALALGRESARLAVVAHRDGASPRVLGRVAATEAGAPVDIDLSELAGDLARIELRAERGEVTVLRPSVVTLDAEEERSETPRPRNVLVYLIDTLRADKLAPYNPETRVRTPGLMRFLEGATTLHNAHTQENWTKPSVATLLSSLMPWEHTAVRGESVVPSSVELLPERLKEHGFHTGSFIANGYVSDRFGFRQGWDTYRNYIREGRRTPAQYVAADVLEWLDDRPEDQPFLLYVHTIDPHVPYRPPDDFLEGYEVEGYSGPVSFRRDATLLENIKLGRLRLRDVDKQQLEALYDGEISYHDVHFAAILDGLERRGLADDTLVIITSDHGEEFWDHGSVGHGHNVYEELLHVPMFVRMPGVTDDLRAVTEPVGLVDVMPTVLDAVGLPIPEESAGRSFLPLLTRGDEPAPRSSVSGFMDGWRTLVTGRIKLIQRTADRVMLYDLETDPGEQNDIAAERPVAVRYARGLLGLTLASSGDAHESTRTRRTRPARRAPRHQAQDTAIDEETEAQLRALGYVDGWR